MMGSYTGSRLTDGPVTFKIIFPHMQPLSLNRSEQKAFLTLWAMNSFMVSEGSLSHFKQEM